MMLERRQKAYLLKGIPIVLFTIWLCMTSLYVSNKFGVIGAIRPFIRAVENRIVLYKTRNFSEIETDRFIYRYENIDQETLDLIIQTAEDKYRSIANIFQYELKEKILIVAYKDTDLMMRTTMLNKGDPPMGVYYGDSIHIADPKLWTTESQNLEEIFYKEGPVLHELVHLFTDHVGRGNFPIWFTEGVSLYFEYRIDGYQWGQEIDFSEKDYSIEELNSNFKRLNQYWAYTKSFRLVKGFVDQHGLEKLMEVIRLLGQGHSFDEFLYLF